jgi:hypothetical protein
MFINLNAAFTPIWQEFLNAAETVHQDNGFGWSPAHNPPASSGFRLLESSTDVNHSWINDGMFAQALEDPRGNIIIAYDSSILLPGQAGYGSPYATGSQIADAAIGVGAVPKAFLDADAFAKDVVARFGSSHNIFLEGHSLGGAEAEFVGNLEHQMSGVTFGAPGIATHGNLGPNQFFINFVDNHDLIGNNSLTGDHFGTVSHLNSVVNSTNSLDFTHHSVHSYAADLHLAPPPYSLLGW